MHVHIILTTGYSNDFANESTTTDIQMENQFYSESKNMAHMSIWLSF